MPFPSDSQQRTELFLRALVHYVIEHPIFDRDGLKQLISAKLQPDEMPDFVRGEETVKSVASRLFKSILARPLNWELVRKECQELYDMLDDAAVQSMLMWYATKYPIPFGGVSMSGAACQACVVNITKLRVGVGQLGEPFGACNNCSSFACGYHGTRDFNIPQLICVECDPNLLCASAAAAATGPTRGGLGPVVPENPLFLEMLRGYRLSWLPREYWAVRSAAEFGERRPGYDPKVFEDARLRSRDGGQVEGDLGTIWSNLPIEAKEMLILAAIITRRMEIPEERLGPLMAMLRSSLR
jgi:hypothetical protein